MLYYSVPAQDFTGNKYYGNILCLVHHFMHNSPQLNLTYLLSWVTLESPLEFKMRLEQCLAAQHEFIMTGPLAGL